MPKPDSACKYIQNNNGPDGVAVFYKKAKFQLLKEERRVLEAWGAATNQVALAMVLRLQETGRELCLATTHLKARKGPLLANIRDQQGADLAAWLHTVRGGRSVILTGDFNAEPAEPVYATITGGAAAVQPQPRPRGWVPPARSGVAMGPHGPKKLIKTYKNK